MKNLSGETKLFLGAFALVFILVIGGALVLARPEPTYTRAEVLLQTTQTRGNTDARVFLVEFSDFQCPFCRSVKSYIDDLVKEKGSDFVFGYRHFPLQKHPFAFKAAVASEAAGKQGKFWEMYDYLFENQVSISDDFISNSGNMLGLDMEKFKSDMNSEELKNKVSKDLADGLKFGVTGTPTFYLNGRKLNIQNLSDVKKAVEEAIAAKTKQ